MSPSSQHNPLLDALEAARRGDPDAPTREQAIARYAFAVPNEDATRHLAEASPSGVVEVGAGTGYWAWFLAARGCDVLAFDIDPPPSSTNPWFAEREPWHDVQASDHLIAGSHADRTLLICWPPKNEAWPAEMLQAYARAGGQTVAFVGESPGGRTGDDTFHALLGAVTSCAQCVFGATAIPCTCGFPPAWELGSTVRLPHWPGFRDDLHLYRRCRQTQGPSGRRRWAR